MRPKLLADALAPGKRPGDRVHELPCLTCLCARPRPRRPAAGRVARRRNAEWGGNRADSRPLPDRIGRRPGGAARPECVDRSRYLTSTAAPASSSIFLIFAASSLPTPSLTGFGAPSTRSLASFRPRPVMVRTSLMTLIFLSPDLGQDDGELGLLLGRSGGRGGGRRGSSRRDRRGGGNAPLLLEQLRELRSLQHREAGQLVHQLL